MVAAHLAADEVFLFGGFETVPSGQLHHREGQGHSGQARVRHYPGTLPILSSKYRGGECPGAGALVGFDHPAVLCQWDQLSGGQQQ